MASIVVAILIVSWIVGPTRGLVGGLLGGFVGAAVAAGMTHMAAGGELAIYYSPATLVRAALPLGVVAAVLALIVPYATGFAALGWGVGAVLAVTVAPRTGQAEYVLPLALQLVVAVIVILIARWSTDISSAGVAGRVRGARAHNRHT